MKAFTPSYEERNRLAVLALQAKHGPIPGDKEPELGALDFVGRDRRQAWQALGQMPQEEAMRQFCQLLHSLCPLFYPFVEAHAKERDERAARDATESLKRLEEEETQERERELKRLESQK